MDLRLRTSGRKHVIVPHPKRQTTGYVAVAPRARKTRRRPINMSALSGGREGCSRRYPVQEHFCPVLVISKVLSSCWRMSGSNPESKEKLVGRELYVTCTESCFRISEDGSEEIDELRSPQEEADIIFFLHAAHATSSEHKAVKTVSDYTDILILCMAFIREIQYPMYQECVTQTCNTYTDIKKVAQCLGKDVSMELLSFHAIT
ncbi:uncharacterized protein LOC111085879 isoform X2 [Limulus polyphemus]|uniref:Uncharacterized protein LOC111085879 isoform X2 n=1 Tax=Limulus polyphemus TaxID=6850 RepID=A0ABM1SF02_LIMPO|nr:uncharacterized protein LOC111085879 isoform X2 [Limulus polyphemus]